MARRRLNTRFLTIGMTTLVVAGGGLVAYKKLHHQNPMVFRTAGEAAAKQGDWRTAADNLGRAAALLPVTNGIARLFSDSPRERAAKKAIVIQTLVYGAMISGMCILTAQLPNMVVSGLLEKQLGIHISYFTWFKLQWPYLGMFAITQCWVQYYFR